VSRPDKPGPVAARARGKAKKAAGPGVDPGGSRKDAAATALLEGLGHPLRREIEVAREVILGADAAIVEAVKWNAPSFKTTDFFATIHLRSRATLQLVFHTGARVKATAETGVDVADPGGLLRWLARDRALVTLGAGGEVEANRAHLEALVRSWVRWV